MNRHWIRCGYAADPSAHTAVVVVALVALLLSGCGGGARPAGVATTRTSRPAPSTTHPSKGPTDSTSIAVLAAYRAGWAAYEQALSTANAYDPALPATMANPLLQKVRANLIADHHDGIVGHGGVQLHPRVTQVTATTATVVDCTYSTSELVYETTGKPVPPVTPPEHDGVRATLVLTNGAWKVSEQSVTEGSCPPGA